jgi:hypothetical protein
MILWQCFADFSYKFGTLGRMTTLVEAYVKNQFINLLLLKYRKYLLFELFE